MTISDIVRRAILVEDLKRAATKNFNFSKNFVKI
jgi:hypothetical protein